MALVTTRDMLIAAQERGNAVAAFNVENMEMAQAVIAAAEEVGAPVIMQTTPSTLRYGSLAMYRAMVSELASTASVDVAMHLDHGDSYDLAMQALRVGYTSVMFDGSALSFEDNVAITRDVVRACAPNGIPVEAELGKVGGKEDDLEVDLSTYTNPAAAVEFVERTGATSLAVAIGTQHGVYKGTPVLDVERLKQIRAVVDIPLVLHGSSGLTAAAVRECIAQGIAKVNFATELRAAYSDAIAEFMAANDKPLDPKVYGKLAREAVRVTALQRLELCHLAGQ